MFSWIFRKIIWPDIITEQLSISIHSSILKILVILLQFCSISLVASILIRDSGWTNDVFMIVSRFNFALPITQITRTGKASRPLQFGCYSISYTYSDNLYNEEDRLQIEGINNREAWICCIYVASKLEVCNKVSNHDNADGITSDSIHVLCAERAFWVLLELWLNGWTDWIKLNIEQNS